MKKIVNFLVCLIFSIMAIGQNETRNLKVINSVCPDADKEIIRVLKTTNGMCNYELGDTESAKRDWDRIAGYRRPLLQF